MKDIFSRIARTLAVLIAIAATWWFVKWYVAVLVATYLCYVAIFSLKRERATYDKESVTYKALTVLGYIFLIPGYLIDWLLNVLSSVPFRDPPNSLWELFTHRMTRYLIQRPPDSYQFKAAYVVCKYFLNPWDEGHCVPVLP